jgi:hypothetical protein
VTLILEFGRSRVLVACERNLGQVVAGFLA